ncbi:hypothetical protein EC973_002355 [Apophysomyces ossiformis]|uniref:Conidiation-specific protein 10 n=1 Tax=Apophysomyces ossiformis TaxID=679940 RepID=A0A8H7BSL4_9FUNG|nr:hypothetical protein EC973_002355 [Apophysomyces ossiformis]
MADRTQNPNPGNFANRPKEEVRNIASKGGQMAEGGGFADMDPEKQRAIASKGGKMSSGKFQPGSERAREAGRKGGAISGRGVPAEAADPIIYGKEADEALREYDEDEDTQ